MREHQDRGYRKLFSNKVLFRQLITSFVSQPWVQELDFSTCELIPATFVSREYKTTFSDLLYKVQWRERDFYIVILLEFKSAPALFVTVQVLGYVLDFYRHLIDAEKELRKLPPVFPIMLYNGEREWTTPLNIADLIEGNEALGEYALHFKCFPILEYAYSADKLNEIGNIVATLFLAETQHDFELLAQKLFALFEREEDKQALSLFLNWYRQLAVHGRVEESDYRAFEKIYHNREEVHMLENAIRAEKKQLWEQGKVEGKLEGKIEGKIEGEREKTLTFARIMVQNGEPLAKIKQYTGLSDEVLLALQTGQKVQ